MKTELESCLEIIFGLESTPKQREEAIQKKNTLIPPKLYKYRNLTNNALNNLKTKTLWFDSPHNMNDPYDCRFSVQSLANAACSIELFNALFQDLSQDLKNNYINRLKTEKILVGELLHDKSLMNGQPDFESTMKLIQAIEDISHKSMVDNLQKTIHFCSLSSNFESMLMWTHYCNEHKGFCIEYDFSALQFDDHYIKNIFPVKYNEVLFDLTPYFPNDIEKLKDIELFKKNKKTTLLNPPEHKRLFTLNPIFQKDINWTYEKEWRVIDLQSKLEKGSSLGSPNPSAILLGSKFFEQFDVDVRNRDLNYLGTLSLAFDLLSFCKNNNLEIKLMKNDPQKFKMISEIVSYDACKKKLIDLKNK
ncbi:DUF2971 domain-containing protein [Acinetobacter gerneri]|uniref:DUF2971 domain-containing protein n=1 Tax=Acinetobacter gerneri TaxID=202952 RepID=UPI003A8B50A4